MELYIFASGSSGNCAMVSSARGQLLIDAGISMRRICTGVKAAGAAPETISGILVTHAHSDHISGIKMMSKYYHLPIYCTESCAAQICRSTPEAAANLNIICPGNSFDCAGLNVFAFPTPHDSPGSVGYRLTDGNRTLAFVTDLGWAAPEVVRAVKGVDTAVLEANHDIAMLMQGPYPYYLKERIISRYGHLSNEDSGKLAAYMVQNGTKQIILAHLSEENNLTSLALNAVNSALNSAGLSAVVKVAKRSELTERVTV